MPGVQAVISDFGGVLTTPLEDSFEAFQESSGVPPSALGEAMTALTGLGVARGLGMAAVWFRSADPAMADSEAARV